MDRRRIDWSVETSAYGAADSRGRQVTRAHLIPPDGTFPNRGAPAAACGQPWFFKRRTGIQVLPLNLELPGQLTWCPKCLGVAAEQLGLRETLARLVLDHLEK